MPGELGDENTQLGVGYYERLYKPTGDWMDPNYGNVHKKDEFGKKETQMDRIMRRIRKRNKKMEHQPPEKDL
jgi:hypothetical protein